jgi:hypothetical protein
VLIGWLPTFGGPAEDATAPSQGRQQSRCRAYRYVSPADASAGNARSPTHGRRFCAADARQKGRWVEQVRLTSPRFSRLDGNGSWLTVLLRPVLQLRLPLWPPSVVEHGMALVASLFGRRGSRRRVRCKRLVTSARDGQCRRCSMYRLGVREPSEHASAARLRTPDNGARGVATGPTSRVASVRRGAPCPGRYFPSRPREDVSPQSGEAEISRARRSPPYLGRARRGSVGRSGTQLSSVGRGGVGSGEAGPSSPRSGEAELGRAKRDPALLGRARRDWVGRGAACLPNLVVEWIRSLMTPGH